jgi:spore maturation protein CgeB
MGHEASLFDPRKYIGVPRPLQRYPLAYAAAEFVLRGTVREPFYFAQKPLLARARALKADLVLVVQLLWVLPETIAELRGLGITCAGWFPDAFTSFGRGTFLLAPWTGLFFQDRFMVARLRQSLSADYIHHLPECMDRVFHRPIALSDDDLRTYGADVATFGNYYPYRAKLIEPLLDGSIDVKLWGAKPPRWLHHKVHEFWAGKVVQGDEKCKAMCAAKIALNTNHYAGIGDVNKRTFELGGMGAFQLTDNRPALNEYFEVGKEVVTFDGRADLLEKVQYYLARPDERQQIAAAAARRAARDHTFEKRLEVLLQTVGLAPHPPDQPR